MLITKRMRLRGCRIVRALAGGEKLCVDRYVKGGAAAFVYKILKNWKGDLVKATAQSMEGML